MSRIGAGVAVFGVLVGCGQGKTGASAPAAAATQAASGVCGLLSLAEVKAVFPDARRSAREESLAPRGIHACDWETSDGARLVQLRVSNSSVKDEIGMFEAGVVDPTGPRRPLPREPVAGGEAVVAQQDEAGGVLQSVGVAAVQKGAQTVVVVSAEIAARERSQAVAALGSLAQAAAARVR